MLRNDVVFIINKISSLRSLSETYTNLTPSPCGEGWGEALLGITTMVLIFLHQYKKLRQQEAP